MSGTLRDSERLPQDSRAMTALTRLQRLVDLRARADEAITAEIDRLARSPGISFRVIGKVLGQPAWLTAQEYQQRHAQPPGVAH
jgi:hypothetical protein